MIRVNFIHTGRGGGRLTGVDTLTGRGGGRLTGVDTLRCLLFQILNTSQSQTSGSQRLNWTCFRCEI